MSPSPSWESDALAAGLAADGVQALGVAADVRDPASVSDALEQFTEAAGPAQVVHSGPLSQKVLTRPVIEIRSEDMTGLIEISIYCPRAAVRQAVPVVRFLPEDGGSILLPTAARQSSWVSRSPGP